MNYRLRPHPQMPRIYLYREPVDFRKSYHGLAAIVEQELGHNPFEGALYAFTNRRRDKIKLLYWEDNGFVLYYKSLAEEKFLPIPTIVTADSTDRDRCTHRVPTGVVFLR